MASTRKPTALMTKHMSKDAAAAREAAELKPADDTIEPPPYLRAPHRQRFVEYAEQLRALGIWDVSNANTLARYTALEAAWRHQYRVYFEEISKTKKNRDPKRIESAQRAMNRAAEAAEKVAAKLGMTITDRYRLIIPKPKDGASPNDY